MRRRRDSGHSNRAKVSRIEGPGDRARQQDLPLLHHEAALDVGQGLPLGRREHRTIGDAMHEQLVILMTHPIAWEACHGFQQGHPGGVPGPDQIGRASCRERV